jgi:uncharacterized protein YozE (UPF0346 family)
MSKQLDRQFSFEISLSVLNHLGRNLYRSFATVLGEAISNAWDADAENVQIYINKEKNSFFIKDDGLGMKADDFQNKFLKIGYSKRKESKISSKKKRPYIGRKGIGKLALLSCADKIIIISKVKNADYIGGTIDNPSLDQAITDDLVPKEYKLGKWDPSIFTKYTNNHEQGTIIYFENIKDGIKHNLEFLQKIIALYFRFSLLDPTFSIFIGGKVVTYECLNDLALKTEFLWKINDIDDPYIKNLQKKSTLKEKKSLSVEGSIKGFIASVERPSDLKIIAMDEKAGVDLFVNGRLRERDILRHIPTTRVVESYLYGQIHFSDLDDDVDRFTSSRESIVADDPKYKELLNSLSDKVISKILGDWDIWRRRHKNDGDPDNLSISKKERKAGELYNAVSGEYAFPKESKNKKIVDDWVENLSSDAVHNFTSYADCFISENLIRKYIQEQKISLSQEVQEDIKKIQAQEEKHKKDGNVNIHLRQSNSNLSYLEMLGLTKLADKSAMASQNCLHHDAKQYRPIRDALMHTALLTEEAKIKLKTVYDNIKSRVKILLSSSENKK